jgi:HlyD family secretion protein
MKRVFTTAVVVAIIAALAYLVLRPRPVPVEMTEAATQTVREYIAEDGKTRLDDEYIIDMPVPGTVRRIEFEVGDSVEEGQIIARVDDYALEQQVRGAKALIAQARAQITGVDVSKPKGEDLAVADKRVEEMANTVAMTRKEQSVVEINYEDAKKNYDRFKVLHEKGAVSDQRFEEVERFYHGLEKNRERANLAVSTAAKAREVAELSAKRLKGSVDDNEFMRASYLAEIERLQAQVNMLQYDLDKASVKAPVTGLILEKYVEDELALPPGTPLMKVGNLSSIEIESDILSEEVGRIKAGDAVEITGKALRDETVMGTVKRVYPSGFMKISALGIEQQRVRVIITFDNSELQLRPGTSVDVRIITGEHEDTVAVPERATFRQNGGWGVFTVEGKRARLTPVEVGLRNDDWAEIVSGLEAGQTVIADPKNELEDGSRVTAL